MAEVYYRFAVTASNIAGSVQRQAHLKEGDTLAVIVEPDGVLRLIPKIVIDRTQAYFWTERWQAGEQEAQADLETGPGTAV